MGFAIQHLTELKKKGSATLFPDTIKIMIGVASCGVAAGALPVMAAFRQGATEKGLPVMITKTGCAGMCYQEPLVDITIPDKGRFVYGRITPAAVPAMLAALQNNDIPDGALFRYSRHECLLDGTITHYPVPDKKNSAHTVPLMQTVPFYKGQYRLVLRNCGFIDPENISEYLAQGGYHALATVLNKKTPLQVIRAIEQSRLRGRGGAGFLTGLKWRICYTTDADQKYIVCNADEGDPGAYMDRSILESDPHAVLEGMLVAAYAIGATKGYVYIRDEYPLAIERMGQAIEQARDAQLVGDHILGSSFSCSISIVRGAGAFVCGEETALLKSIEGLCGEPHQRPPYPAVAGLWGKPTVINNVETLATIPVILTKGARWFSTIGTKKSTGTKVFSLVGKINHIGLVEVPLGTPLRDIIYTIGGGAGLDRTCKAVQTGGPSGGCIPEHLFNLPVEYDTLAHAGSIMGSGGMIVMDNTTCMVDVARYFMTFLEHESCGKCTPCRVGVRRMRELLDGMCKGTASEQDLYLLEQIARVVSTASLCGLGRTAPNPVLSGLRYFKDEFILHVRDKKCPAGVCNNLITYGISLSRCTGCGTCIKTCPVKAITGTKKKPHTIDTSRCIKCGACEEVCPVAAIAPC